MDHLKQIVLGCIVVQLIACGDLSNPQTTVRDKTPIIWQIPNQTTGVGASAVAGSIYAVINGDGTATAYDLVARKPIWNTPASLKAAIDENVQSNGQLIAFEANKSGVYLMDQGGNVLHFFAVPNEITEYESGITAHTTFYGTHLYIPFRNILIKYEISDPKNPQEIWRKTFDHNVDSLVVDDIHVYTGRYQFSNYADADTITTLNSNDGSIAWKSTTNQPDVYPELPVFLPNWSSTRQFSLFEDTLLVMTYAGDLQAFSKSTGKRLWVTANIHKTTKGCYATGKYILQDGVIYLSSESDSCVFALNAKDGSLKWIFDAHTYSGKNSTFGGKPAVYHGVVYAANSWLWALDATTGEPISVSSVQDGAATFQNVQVVNGEVIIRGSNLTAFKTIQ
jgi:outer membrane protein assembly factor BamB